MTYLEVLAHHDKLAISVDVAHARSRGVLDLQADPRPHLVLLNHLDVLYLLAIDQSFLAEDSHKPC